MKKIISALTVSALVAGAAFADVAIALNYRQRATLLSHTPEVKIKDTVSVAEQSTIFYTDAYNGSGTDNLSITLGGDIVSFQAVLVGDQTATSSIRAKTLGADLKLGKVQFFGGVYADGKVKGAYRNKTDIDAGNMEGVDFEFEKLGSRFKNSPSMFVDNIAYGVNNGDEPWVFGAKYAVPGMKKVKLELNGTYVTNTRRAGSSQIASSGNLQGHTFAGLVEARTGFGTGEFVFKYGEYKAGIDAMAFGAYLQPVLVDNLTVTIGGAGSTIDGNFTDWSADLRLYYKMGDLSFTSFHNISALVNADKDETYKHINASNKGIADSGAGKGAHKGTTIKRDLLIANNLMARYKVNSKFAVYGVIADFIGNSYQNGKLIDNGYVVETRASAWAQFYAGSSSISLGFVFENYNEDVLAGLDWETVNVKNIAIPMIFRVKM